MKNEIIEMHDTVIYEMVVTQSIFYICSSMLLFTQKILYIKE